MKMRVHVRKTHIKKGKRGSENSCPIALALKAAGFSEATVDGTEIECDYGPDLFAPDGRAWLLSAKLIEFVQTFDQNRKVRPMSFVLDDERRRITS